MKRGGGGGRLQITPWSTAGSLHFLPGDDSPLPNPRLNAQVGNTDTLSFPDLLL